jgi:hypothetical protein
MATATVQGENLRDLVQELDEVRGRLDAAVAAARSAGESWHRIALAVGMTAEGARRRWAGSGPRRVSRVG